MDKVNHDKIISEFKKNYGIQRVIAFSGGSSSEISGVPEGDPLQAQYKKFSQELETRILRECIGKLRGFQIAILTGGTKWGVPKTAIEIAKSYGIKTIGIYPLAGKKHALGDEHLDLSLCIEPRCGESRWGDESPIFSKLLDGVIVFSGGAGTLIECAHILKINEALQKNGLPVKYIVPISGTGGVADGLPFIWAKPEIRSICMPHSRVCTGAEAADIIIDKLNLYDYIQE